MRKSFSLAFVIMFALMFALICIITGCELDDPMDLTCTLDGETYEYTLYSTSYPTIKLTMEWNKAVKVMTYRKLPGASAYSLVDSKVVTMGVNNKGTYTYKASANDLGSGNNMLPTEYRIEVYSNDDNTLKTTFETSLQPVTGTDIPTAWINTANNAAIVDKETWIDGTMELEGTDYDISIKGRGHKSWEQVKKPYAIKLDSKASLLGMPKGKRWVLIANYLDNSFLKNSAAFLVSEALGMDYTVRGDFVHLVLNGQYMGLYWLGEAIRIASDRVDIDEDVDFLLEADTHYDGDIKFTTTLRGMPINVKNDEKTMGTDGVRLNLIKSKMNAVEADLYSASPTYEHIDMLSFAQFYLTFEILQNEELIHPKSVYLVYDMSEDILKAGPVWDFDWAAFDDTRTTLLNNNNFYYGKLNNSQAFRDTVETLLNLPTLNKQTILAEIDTMADEIRDSASLDLKRWGRHHDPKGPGLTTYFTFQQAVNYLKSVISTRIDLLEDVYCD